MLWDNASKTKIVSNKINLFDDESDSADDDPEGLLTSEDRFKSAKQVVSNVAIVK